MLFRRISKHVKDQNWVAVAVDFAIVVIGVYTAVWVQGFQDRTEENRRKAQVITTMRADITDSTRVEVSFDVAITDGIARWQDDFEAGLMPPPYFFRTPGSDTPPIKTWDALLNMNVGELLPPPLVFDLAFYYSEREGVANKYLRYVTFVENDILPHMEEDSSVFYVEDGSRLKSEYISSMKRLASWAREARNNMLWGKCLDEKLNTPDEAEGSCAPAFSLEHSGPRAFGEQHQ